MLRWHLVCTKKVTPLAGVWIESDNLTGSEFDEIVTPLAGVWIERHLPPQWEHLWQVTPLAGVWIESRCGYGNPLHSNVTPLAGVWIERLNAYPSDNNNTCHSPCGSVD